MLVYYETPFWGIQLARAPYVFQRGGSQKVPSKIVCMGIRVAAGVVLARFHHTRDLILIKLKLDLIKLIPRGGHRNLDVLQYIPKHPISLSFE
jgi:hypothetical protein